MVINKTLRGSVMLSGLSLGDHLNKLETSSRSGGRNNGVGEGGGGRNRAGGGRGGGTSTTRGFKGTTLESVTDTEPTVDMEDDNNESFAAIDISLDENGDNNNNNQQQADDDVSLPSLQPGGGGGLMNNNSIRSLKSTRSTGTTSRSPPSSPITSPPTTTTTQEQRPDRRGGIKPRGAMTRAYTDDGSRGPGASGGGRLAMMREQSEKLVGARAGNHHHPPVHATSGGVGTLKKQKSLRRTRSLNNRGENNNNGGTTTTTKEASFRVHQPKLKVSQSSPIDTTPGGEIKWSRGKSNRHMLLQKENSLKFSSHHTVRVAGGGHMSSRDFENMHSSFFAGNHSSGNLSLLMDGSNHSALDTFGQNNIIATGITSGGGGGSATFRDSDGGEFSQNMGRLSEGAYVDMDFSGVDLEGSGTRNSARRRSTTASFQEQPNDAVSALLRFGQSIFGSGGTVAPEEDNNNNKNIKQQEKRTGEPYSSSRRRTSNKTPMPPGGGRQQHKKDPNDVDILGSLGGLPGHWTRNAECIPSSPPNSPKKEEEVNYLPSLTPRKSPTTFNNIQEKFEDSLFVQNLHFIQDYSRGVRTNLSNDVDRKIANQQEQVMDSRFVQNVNFLQDYTQEKATDLRKNVNQKANNLGKNVNRQISNVKQEQIDESRFVQNINFLQDTCQTFASNLGDDVHQEIKNRQSLFLRNVATIGTWFNNNNNNK